MEALIFLAVVTAVVGMIVSVFKLNRWCLETYDYKPFSLTNFLLVLPGYLLLFIAVVAYSHVSLLNIWVLCVAALISWIILLGVIARRSSIWVGIYSLLVMLIAWLPVIVLFMLKNDGANQRHHQRTAR